MRVDLERANLTIAYNIVLMYAHTIHACRFPDGRAASQDVHKKQRVSTDFDLEPEASLCTPNRTHASHTHHHILAGRVDDFLGVVARVHSMMCFGRFLISSFKVFGGRVHACAYEKKNIAKSLRMASKVQGQDIIA